MLGSEAGFRGTAIAGCRQWPTDRIVQLSPLYLFVCVLPFSETLRAGNKAMR